MNKIDLDKVFRNFDIKNNAQRYGNGHINDTYLVVQNDYILQRINTKIFTKPYELMQNIEKVTEFLRGKIKEEGGNPDKETLTVIKTADGQTCYKYDDENYFRLYKFIGNTVTIENEKNSKILYNAGIGFGKFQRLLDKFPAAELYETIADFHDTPKRVEALKKAIEEDKVGRAKSVKKEIEFALKNADFTDVVVKGLKDGSIPLRVTHNDTKINNILFDEKTLEAVAVIDLDTVMPGSALYDFGDALRMGGSTGAEDETDLDKVNFDEEAFRNFARGYCKEVGDKLTDREYDLLYIAPKLLTYECGIRFLTDYLNGDTYFKIKREHHNLDRARNQFKLVEDMGNKADKLKKIVKEVRLEMSVFKGDK